MQEGAHRIVSSEIADNTRPIRQPSALKYAVTVLTGLTASSFANAISPSDTPQSHQQQSQPETAQPIAFKEIPAGASLLNRDMVMDVTGDPTKMEVQKIHFRIDHDAQTNALSITVNGKTYESHDTIWWLAFAKVKDILSDAVSNGDGAIVLTADNIGSVTLAPIDVEGALRMLATSSHSTVEIQMSVLAKPIDGSVAQRMLGECATKIVTCTAHCERMPDKIAPYKQQQLAKK